MLSELYLDSSKEIIKTYDKDLIFRINKKEISKALEQVKNKNNQSNNFRITSECIIKIENLSCNYVALRIRTTKKYSYSVDPIYTIISPKKDTKIKILYHSSPGHEITSNGHKFRFEGFIIEDKEKNTKNILGLFQQYIKSQKLVQGNIIKKNVNFIEDNNYVLPTKIHLTKKIAVDIPLRGISKNNPILNKKLEQEIRECNKLRLVHQNLYEKITVNDVYENNKNNETKNIINNNNISFKNIIKDGIELFKMKYSLVVLIYLFFISTSIGFYLNNI